MTTSNDDPAAKRNLPDSGWARTRALLSRALRKRCPQCGAKGIFKNYLELRETCPNCEYRFDREEGYFLGGYALGVVFTGLIPLVLLIFAFAYTDFDWVTLELIFIPMVILLPLILFPYTRTLWMMIDLQIDPNGHTEKRLRHHHLDGK